VNVSLNYFYRTHKETNLCVMKLPYILAAGILATGVLSCSDDEYPTSCRLNRSTSEGNTKMQAYYDGSQRLQRIVVYNDETQVIDQDFRVYRNGDGNIDSTYCYNASGELIAKYRMLYNIDDEIGRIDLLADLDSDGDFEVTEHFEILYEGGEVSEIRKFNLFDVQTGTYTFEWQDGNVTQFNNNGPTLELDYDNKLNLYTGIGKDVLFLNPQLMPIIMSKNNPMEVIQHDASGSLEFTLTIVYEYNEHDLPSQSTANLDGNTTVTYYDYDCD